MSSMVIRGTVIHPSYIGGERRVIAKKEHPGRRRADKEESMNGNGNGNEVGWKLFGITATVLLAVATILLGWLRADVDKIEAHDQQHTTVYNQHLEDFATVTNAANLRLSNLEDARKRDCRMLRAIARKLNVETTEDCK